MEPAMVSVPVGLDGGVPVAFWLAASHDTLFVLKLVGSNAAEDAAARGTGWSWSRCRRRRGPGYRRRSWPPGRPSTSPAEAGGFPPRGKASVDMTPSFLTRPALRPAADCFARGPGEEVCGGSGRATKARPPTGAGGSGAPPGNAAAHSKPRAPLGQTPTSVPTHAPFNVRLSTVIGITQWGDTQVGSNASNAPHRCGWEQIRGPPQDGPGKTSQLRSPTNSHAG